MADSNRFRLPDSFGDSGDPVDGNPFPADDLRHSLWTEATRKAETFVAEAKQKAFGTLTLATAERWLTDLCLQKFHIWAWRGHWVVWTDADIAAFDNWLVRNANSWIETVAQHLANAPFPTDAILLNFRNDLGRHIEFWKREARSRAEQFRSMTATSPRPEPSKPSRPVVTEGTVAWRRKQVSDYRRARDWSAVVFARHAHLSESAINGIVREDWTRFSEFTRDRLLSTLGLSIAQWYQE